MVLAPGRPSEGRDEEVPNWGGAGEMKPILLVLGIAVLAGAAQAQTAHERLPKGSPENPSLVTALRNWIASKTAALQPADKRTAEKAAPVRHVAAEPRPHRRYRIHHYRVRDTEAPRAARIAPPAVPTLASAAPTAPAENAPVPSAVARAAPSIPVAVATESPLTTASIALTKPAPTRSLTPENLNMPRPVATITVIAPQPSEPSRRHGISHCTSGERIITAYYWEGKHTASGARFDPDGYTAAHRTLPFGTRLLVINPRNGKSVTVTVNDRGPFVRGVTLDISRGAAKAIGLQGNAAVCMAKL